MPDDEPTTEHLLEWRAQRGGCDHICRLDDGHVERGEPHQYSYEVPSPRAGSVRLRHAARRLVDVAATFHRAEEWPAILRPIISEIENLIEGRKQEVRSCVSVTAVTPVTAGSLCCAPDGSVLGRAINTAEQGEQVGIQVVPESGQNEAIAADLRERMGLPAGWPI